MSQKKLIPEAELGAALHTALRKACDSTPTSLAYNLVSLIDDSSRLRAAWGLYRARAWHHLSGVGVEVVDPVNCLKLAAADLGFHGPEDVWRENRGYIEKAGPALTALLITFEGFDDGDWEGFAAYLIEEPEAVS